MAKTDWDISGTGGQSVIDMDGSMRCQLTQQKLMLWNGNTGLTDSEVICELRAGYNNHLYNKGGMVLRCDPTAQNCYKLQVQGPRTYYIYKIVSGVVTTLGNIISSQAWNLWIKTRFRVDGHQLSVEEYTGGQWNLILTIDDSSQAHASGAAGLFGNSYNSVYYWLFDNVEIGEKV